MEKKITLVLKELGCPSNLSGFQFLRYALCMILNSKKKLPTGTIYEQIANEFNSSYSRVERAIRHTIEISALRGNIDTFNQVFGWSLDVEKCKPTNSEFMFAVADFVRYK